MALDIFSSIAFHGCFLRQVLSPSLELIHLDNWPASEDLPTSALPVLELQVRALLHGAEVLVLRHQAL